MSGKEAHELSILAARAWRFRHGIELAVAERFRRIAVALERHGLPPRLVAIAHDSSHDEERHAELCASLVAHLGGTRLEATLPASRRPSWPDEFGSLSALTREVVGLSCVVESVSVAALGSLLEHAGDETVRGVLQHVLRDEIAHARLGWGYLAWLTDRGDAGATALAEIGDALPQIFASALQDELFAAGAEVTAEHVPTLASLGVLARPARRRVACETLRVIVLPGLASFGVPTRAGSAWLESKDVSK